MYITSKGILYKENTEDGNEFADIFHVSEYTTKNGKSVLKEKNTGKFISWPKDFTYEMTWVKLA